MLTRVPHASCSQWKLTFDSRRAVEYSFTGIVTRPKLRDAVPIARGAIPPRRATFIPRSPGWAGAAAHRARAPQDRAGSGSPHRENPARALHLTRAWTL